MTTETIIPVYVPSYMVTAPTYTLSVSSTGTVGSGGVATQVEGVYTVVNSGRIGTPAATYGVLIVRGGTVINNLGATIASGGVGVSIGTGYEGRGTHTSFGSVVNDGTILAGTGAGLLFSYNPLQGVFVTNGGTGDTTALISGRDGILDWAGLFASVDTTIGNFGTIQGTGGVGDAGVKIDEGTSGTIVNGSSLDSGALIKGYVGVDGTGDAELVVQNFGTIEGTGADAVLLGSPSDTLIVEAGASFIGEVDGAGGTLVLAGDAGAGTLAGLGTSFAGFNDVSVAGGATWTLAGTNTITAGTIFVDDGTLTDAGSITGGIRLGATSRLSIAGGAYLSNNGTGSAVYSQYTVSVVNQGTIKVQAPGAGTAGYYGIDLANGGSIDNGGTITGNNFAGLRVLGGVSVTNSGLIASGRAGVFADFGVSIDNTGRIDGPINGVFARNGAATITNAGTIYGNNAIWVLNGPGVITNSGTLVGLAYRAVSLTGGGTVTNQAGGLIAAPANNVAVYIGGANYTATAAGVVTNAGTITGGTGIAFYAGDTLSQTVIDSGTIIGSSGTAVAFSAGNDTLSLQPSTSTFIQGVVDGGGGTNTLEFASGAVTGTLTGLGADFVDFGNGTVDAGASWVLAGSNTLGAGTTLTNSGTLTDAGTLVNAGTLLTPAQALQVVPGGSLINTGSIGGNTGSGAAVSVAAGGSVTNQSGGTISGFYGVYATGGSATVANAGSIAGSPLTGVGVNLRDGGLVSNQSGGLISGGNGGVWVVAADGTVVNAGSISSTDLNNGYAVLLNAGGSVTNQSGGVMDGFRGVEVVGAAATVTNAGTISGDVAPGEGLGVSFFNAAGTLTNQSGGTISGGLDAVRFAAGYNNLLVIDPGAVFIGAVTGGNSAGATNVSVLELAAGADAGTLTGLGSQFVDFARSTIDSGASWTFAAGNTIGTGYTLTNDGTLTNTGTLLDAGTLIDNGLLANDGTITAASSLLVAGTLDNAGWIDPVAYDALALAPGGYLYNATGADIIRGTSGKDRFDPAVVGLSGGASTIRNLGTIANIVTDVAIYLRSGGMITNGSASDTTALIYAALPVYIYAGRGTVTNFGTIEARPIGGLGIELNQGGLVVNGASGSTAASILGGQYGVFAVDGPTTLTNFGTIVASYNGFGFDQSSGIATIFNAGVIGATNGSGVGIDLADGGTIIDSGTVEGANTAIRFGGTGSNLLVLENGYEFFGLIQGSASASNTLELVGSVGAPVTEKYLQPGVGLLNFQTVEFGPGDGNYATLGISNDAELPATIAGFVGIHDTIDLAALSDAGNNATTSFNALTDVLTVTGDNGSVALQLGNGDYTDIGWVAQNDGDGGTAVRAVNGPPVVAAGATADFTGGGGAAVLDSALTISDPSSSTLVSATVSIGAGFVFGDTLNFTNQDNITGSYNTATGVLTLSGTASVADYQAALESIAYSFSPPDGDSTGTGNDTTRTISWTVNDGTNSSTAVTSTLDTTHVAPTIAASGSVAYTIGGSAVTLDPTVSVADVDSSGNLAGAEIAITGGIFAGDGDLLVANLAGTGITATYDSANETLTLSGTATLAEYEAVLSTVAFSSSGGNPTDGGTDPSRTISWTVNDGTAVSNTSTTTVTLSYTPPVIAGAVAGQTTTDEAADHPFASVTITDPNPSPGTETLTITLTNDGVATDADGTLSGTGLSQTGAGTYTLVAGSAAEATAELQALTFTPTAHQVAPGDTVTTGFTIVVADTADSSSSNNSTTSVTATAVDDPPAITGTVAGQLINDDQTDRPFASVTITDPDLDASETVTITLNVDGSPSDANGTLSGTGLTETSPGIYTLTAGTPAAVTAALRALIFTPAVLDLPPNTSAVTDMTLSVSDGTANPPTIDTTTSVAIVPCFAAGTRIATPRGAVAVERLREGDTVLTISGKPQRIQWTGCRTLDCNRHTSPERVKPIRIAAHAFGENRPRRALLLSPDHSVFVEDVFIPIKHLVNGTTVTQIDVATVTYYHIELPRHDVVLAEGLPAETYLETGARLAFENGGGALELHPDFAPDEARVGMVWRNFSYAPLIGSDGQLDRVRARLALQALMLEQQASAAPPRARKRAAGR